MMRKAALAVMLPLLIGASDAVDPPAFTVKACTGARLGPALEPVKRLFADHAETRAMLIVADGCPALKAYAPGYSDHNRFISWSMAKSVTAMLVGELVADGRLQLDAPAPIAEWHGVGDPRAAITLRQLLNMSSGLQHIEVGNPIEASDTNQTLFVADTGKMAAAAIGHRLEARPGTRFNYSSLTSIILAEIVTRTLADSRNPRTRAQIYTAFARERLFRPAGVRSAVLEYDGAGTQIGGSLMHMTLDDWGRIGGLLLDGRGPDGAQVIAPEWLAFMKTPSPANGQYGGQLWLNRSGIGRAVLFPGKGPASAVGMDGHLGQLVIASPDSGRGRGVVIVRLGNTPDVRNPAMMQTLGDVTAAFDRGRR
jgi:CubicO group peptidase (beta-lactamase class C family)